MGKLASKPSPGNIIPLHPQAAWFTPEGQAALHYAQRAAQHGGRKGLVLIRVAGYFADQALNGEPRLAHG